MCHTTEMHKRRAPTARLQTSCHSHSGNICAVCGENVSSIFNVFKVTLGSDDAGFDYVIEKYKSTKLCALSAVFERSIVKMIIYYFGQFDCQPRLQVRRTKRDRMPADPSRCPPAQNRPHQECACPPKVHTVRRMKFENVATFCFQFLKN